MLDFKEITLEDKIWVDEILSSAYHKAADYNFTVIYIWRTVFNKTICRYKNFLLIRFCEYINGKAHYKYMYPIGNGTNNDIVEIVNLYKQAAQANNEKLILYCVSKEDKETFKNLFPDNFVICDIRDYADYIYSAEDLIYLKGKKYQSKRNFISRFKKLGDWSYERITQHNIQECILMNKQWCLKNGCVNEKSMLDESCSVKIALSNYEQLKLSGGLLRLNGKVVAFTIGEKMNADTALIHVEKAFSDVVGAYPTISNEFLKDWFIDSNTGNLLIKYINREDDSGDPGLRAAKMQYHPAFLIEKCSVTEK